MKGKPMSWQDKVKESIAAQCLDAYRAANPRIRHGQKAKPYHVPELARAMVAALDSDNEEEGKRLLLICRTGALSLI
jgi:hypothetical protein